jgi:hypothetical protein
MINPWIIISLALLVIAVAGYRKQIKVTIWYLRRRWNVLEMEEKPTRCAEMPGGDVEGLKEIFMYLAKRLGGRCEFDHFIQYVDKNKYGRQLLSCRIISEGYQYHYRVMPSSGNRVTVTGHYETTPERHPLKHYFGINADLGIACKIFKMFYDEYGSQRYQI